MTPLAESRALPFGFAIFPGGFSAPVLCRWLDAPRQPDRRIKPMQEFHSHHRMELEAIGCNPDLLVKYVKEAGSIDADQPRGIETAEMGLRRGETGSQSLPRAGELLCLQ